LRLRVGIDIGGAFTDLVAYDPHTGSVSWVKTETTPEDFSEGVMECIRKSQLDLGSAAMIIHGQTLVINTIVTRSGARVGLITTKGFRDVLELQRSNRRDIYNFRYHKPPPLVPRYLRQEVDERVLSSGEVLRPLDHHDLKRALEELTREGVEALVISFINAYVNPKHEEEAAKLAKEFAPHLPLTLASRVTREWREYERTCTAVLNAYVMPKVSKYLERLEEGFRSRGFRGHAFTMLSSGGMAPFGHAKQYPITTMESGPVAGVIGSIALAEALGLRNIITLDGGSTTTKASLVQDLSPTISTAHYVERDEYRPGYPVFVPTLEVVEVGNGGTSIIWIDSIGNVKVGPRSAGAYPGPACYGKGGREPTVTDAYVLTGLLNPRYLLGGALKIDASLSERAMKPLAEKFDRDLESFSEGAIKLANDNAAYAIRLVSVQRGYDPRDFTLIAYGGSGPMFAPFIAQELEIERIVVPSIPPGVFSAWGMLVTDVRHDLVVTNPLRLDDASSLDRLNHIYGQLEAQMLAMLREKGFDREVALLRGADMRYYGQEHTVRVDVMPGHIGAQETEELIRRFSVAHERKYAFKLEGNPVEVVNFHVTGIVRMEKAPLKEAENRGSSAGKALKEEREVFFDGKRSVWPIYDRALLPAGVRMEGPLVIEDPTSTIIVLRGQKAFVDRYGNIIIGGA
jgi:N-methylhydantoinase A